jgi:hydroxyethylthiazole kinase
MHQLAAAVWADLERIRSQTPLVLNITNLVAMDFTANALLAIGASPIMSTSLEEIAELVGLAHTVVVNMGTLGPIWEKNAAAAIQAAKSMKKPVVFDPVGVGASKYRTDVANTIVRAGGIAAIRANGSEVLALFSSQKNSRGVDSSVSSDIAITAGRQLAAASELCVVVSGEVDQIIHDNRSAFVKNGDPLMAKVTAMGCVSTAIIGAFLAVNTSPLDAALHAMVTMGVCGELAKTNSGGPGSFRMAFLDALATVTEIDVQNRLHAGWH